MPRFDHYVTNEVLEFFSHILNPLPDALTPPPEAFDAAQDSVVHHHHGSESVMVPEAMIIDYKELSSAKKKDLEEILVDHNWAKENSEQLAKRLSNELDQLEKVL